MITVEQTAASSDAADTVHSRARFAWTCVGMIMAAFFVLYALRPIDDFDYWWHLRTGELIAQMRALPSHDLFSHTIHGEPILVHSWLAELLQYIVWRAGGAWGTRLANATAMAMAMALLWHLAARHATNYSTRIALLAVSATLVCDFISWRPRVASVLMLLLLLPVIARAGTIKLSTRRLVIVILAIVLWANLHPMVVAVLPFYWVAFGAAVVTHRFPNLGPIRLLPNRTSINLRHGLLVGLLLTAATLVTPNGIGIHEFAISGASTSRVQALRIHEWLSPLPALRAWFLDRVLRGNWSALTVQDFNHAIFLGSFVIILASWIHAIFKQREVNLQSLAFSAVCVLFAASVNRGRWWIVFPLAISISQWPIPATRVRRLWAPALLASVVTALTCIGIAGRVVTSQVFSSREESHRFPSRLCSLIVDAGLQGNLFNPYDWGGYCIYRLYPGCLVFIDGRNVDYGKNDPDVVNDFLGVYKGDREFARLALDRRGVDMIVVPPGVFGTPLVHLEDTFRDAGLSAVGAGCQQTPPQGWMCVFLNSEGALFLRKSDQRRLSKLSSFLKTFDLDDADWRPFRPSAILSKSPSFALRYGLVGASYYRDLKNSDVNSLVLRADALMALYATKQAAAMYDAALTMQPRHLGALFGAARAAHNLGDVARSKGLAKQVYQLFPQSRAVRSFCEHVLNEPHDG